MLDKPLEQIGLADLEELITDKVQEGKSIDYKRDMYRLDSPNADDRDKHREEFLKDVSSFANTIGGHLIIGMAEANGVPTDIPGVALDDPENMKNRLHQLIDRWLEPRISCGIYAVEKEPGNYVLVIHVPQSLVSPHRVVYQNRFRQFWARKSARADMMDTSELRRAFTLSESIYEQIRQFRKDRVRLIMEGETPVPRDAGSKLILHLIPLESVATQVSFDVRILRKASGHFWPLCVTEYDCRINLDGFLTYFGASYTQVFRNGMIEATRAGIAHRPTGTTVGVLDIETIERVPLGYPSELLERLQGVGDSASRLVLLDVNGNEECGYQDSWAQRRDDADRA